MFFFVVFVFPRVGYYSNLKAASSVFKQETLKVAVLLDVLIRLGRFYDVLILFQKVQ